MNNINASIVDQQLDGMIQSHPEVFGDHSSSERNRALAFVVLCVKTSLNIDFERAIELITEGGNDFGIDALYVGEEDDGEFTVTIFQGKYKVKDLSGMSNFPENGVKAAIGTISALFDPLKPITVNPKLAPKLEEIRSLVRDGLIPNVRFVLCNNGARWNDIAEQAIENAAFPREQVSFLHFNHDNIVNVQKAHKKIDESLQMSGKAIVEEYNYRRVLIGRVCVTQIADLFNRHEDVLLERNIRRYLGLHSNRVNSSIHSTLCSDQKREDFYFLNNGITIVCNQFSHNALQESDYNVRISGLQVVNGGQTCKTIQQTLKESPDLRDKLQKTFVLVRIYEVRDDRVGDFVGDITFATNSQNPIDLRDLHANDDVQKSLELGLKELGVVYKRKRDEDAGIKGTVTSLVVAESVLAIWRQCPHQARFMYREHFGKLYNKIFSRLNASQALLAVLIFRFVENERKRPTLCDERFLPYSAHYVAMRLGVLFLRSLDLKLEDISHRNYQAVNQRFEARKRDLYKTAVADVKRVLSDLYGGREDLSLQQLSATFRRGDLIMSLI